MTIDDWVPLFVPVPAGSQNHVASCQICTVCPRSLSAHVRTHHGTDEVIQVRSRWFVRRSTLRLLGRD